MTVAADGRPAGTSGHHGASAYGASVASARDLVGADDDHLFLAVEAVVVPLTPDAAWALLEGDHQQRLLAALSPRFAGRGVLEALPDGYRCTTTSKGRFGRLRRFESVVWLDPPHRSVELQLGTRTELRYTTSYEAVPEGTRVRCEQAYRARSASFESGAAIGALQQRAASVVADRVQAAARLAAADPLR